MGSLRVDLKLFPAKLFKVAHDEWPTRKGTEALSPCGGAEKGLYVLRGGSGQSSEWQRGQQGAQILHSFIIHSISEYLLYAYSMPNPFFGS